MQPAFQIQNTSQVRGKLEDLELASDSPAQRIQHIHSQAIKTASLDHITQPSVLSSSPSECLSCRYETSWIGEKETRWPFLREREGKIEKKEGAREPDECWQSAVRVKPRRSVIGPARHPPTSARFVQTFHYSLVAIATETKPSQPLCYCWSLAKGCLMQGWSGAGGRRG